MSESRLSALIVDDEPLARSRLRGLLKGEAGIDIAGECGNGREAAEFIRAKAPDLVFLDVQMPELDGFGVISAIGAAQMPAVIFTTAFDQYALKAFEVHALDYLLKPFDKERFKIALDKAKKLIQGSGGRDELTRRLAAALADLEAQQGRIERVAIKGNNRIYLVKLGEVRYIEAAGNYLHLHAGQPEPYVLRETMNTFEARLEPKKFVHIHRSTIVNVDYIKELQPLFHGDYVVLLNGGARLTLSRGYRDKLALLAQAEI